MCGGSNLSTDLLLWGIYIKKYISLVRICLQTRNARNASTKFRKTLESKKAEKSLEISAFLVFSCLHLNQTLIMAGMAGFEPTNARVKVWCLTAWRHPNVLNFVIIPHLPPLCQVFFAIRSRIFLAVRKKDFAKYLILSYFASKKLILCQRSAIIFP